MESIGSSSQSSAGLDIIAPSIMFLSPQSGAYLRSPFQAQGSCEDGLSISYIIDGATPASAVPCQQNMFSIDLSSLADGNHTIEISQTDAAGNTANSSLSFQVDKTAPAINIASPAANATLTTTSINVSGTCQGSLPIILSGTALAAPVSLDCSAGSFQSPVTLTGTNGIANIKAEQTDLADNVGSTSRNVNIQIPVGAPVVKILSPAANYLTKTRTITLSGSCEQAYPVEISGTGVTAKTATCTASAFQTTVTLTVGDGMKNVIVKQSNGSQVGQDARTFMLDMTAPALTIASPAQGTKAVSNVVLSGVCENGLPVTITGTGIAATKSIACAMSVYSITIDFSAGLGIKAVNAEQTDAAGNKATVTTNFERIDPAPVPIDGRVLYANNCQACHEDLANSTKLGRTATQITNAISLIPQMNFLKLTAAEITAVADVLKVTLPPPTTTLPTLPLSTATPAPTTSALMASTAFGVVPTRRLTRTEVVNSIKYILTISPVNLIDSLPEDIVDEAVNPFNNDVTTQSVSLRAVEGYDKFAQDLATDFQTRTSVINTLAGCTPTGVADSTCFSKFVANVGRLFLRREITSADQTKFAALLSRATAMNNYYVAPALAVQALIMHPEFLYRIEVGTAVMGSTARALTNYEIATRMAYLAWGSAPDKALLDAAAAGSLKTESSRISQLQRLLADARAKAQAYNFHAQWLGYAEVGLPTTGTLAVDMKQETEKLLDQTLFTSSNAKWLDIFSATQTYVTPALATYYGMTAPSATGWVSYTAPKGGGILAHGQFAAQGAKFGDTSPTLRGYGILKRVFCQKFGPVPIGVDPDSPPPATGGSNCKNDTYNMRYQTACSSCHTLTDNIGFGLENYSPWGQWRVTEPNRPTCNIKGEGALGNTLFTGPKQLGDSIATQPLVAQCVSRQLLRFALGRADVSSDENTIAAMHTQYNQTPQYTAMIEALVRSQAFIQK